MKTSRHEPGIEGDFFFVFEKKGKKGAEITE